ncbi:DUF6265 family protein [Aliiglaciecola sp. CAU 1673]|uniref:DUF6265 family protein n=1 Tax=Aliiglaciecola sp. CAU 1673 TaxID=3032595 RepID=UPI0023DC6EAA|nr:DUF6265 family protein [Aliiglaciecola sp. CAU 1673]MDF2178015.1 DUF6265 family protein [Aliiglaciecola sp. CAU 1673]
MNLFQRQYSYLLLTALLGAPIQAQATCRLTDLSWLLATWQMPTEKGQVLEAWQQVSDNSYEGRGWSIKQGEVSRSEDLRLVQMQDKIFYLAKVTENPMPVPFLLTTCSANQAIFENPEHDYPQRLHYQLEGTDTLDVKVEDLNGKGFALRFQKRH